MNLSKQQLFIIILFLFSTILRGANINYYIEIGKSEIELGQYIGKHFQKKVLKRFPKNNVDAEGVSAIIPEEKGQKVLFYFHSMWGAFKPYHQNSLRKLNGIDGVDKIISIVWHADNIGYKKAWEKSIHQGQIIRPIIQQLVADSSNTFFVLCHSLGHRVFEGLIQGLGTSVPRFEAVFFAAADLDVDVFEKNLTLLPERSTRIVLYINQKDRALKLSKRAHQRERLGLNAVTYLNVLEPLHTLEIVDITQSKRRLFDSKSSHIYFKNRPSVLCDIAHVINKQAKERQEQVKSSKGMYTELK